ncbi:tetratricopeptide repeat protein [uncultured Maricaulis sp.]|uniref:tetratricopeptide repeat protein n=1 Tax=uncultured Maricaulis sp. TaxID=174710 RepID=UPI0030D86C93|tara:strand:+ start:43459 stop:45255 length:1797 start_codon:yes stop_codon:yes gene_type:complete
MVDALPNVPSLIDEFSAPAESGKNAAIGARGVRGSISTEVRLGLVPKNQRDQYRKAANLAKRAIRMSDDGDHQGAAKPALAALDLAPDYALPNHTIGLILFRLGRLSRALQFYERAWRIDPRDAEIYLNMGIVAWKLDMLDAAEKFYRLCVDLAPENMNGLINLASVLRDQGRYDDAIELLRAQIFLRPENVDLWNSLGTVVADSGDPVGSVPFYTEALRINPGFARGHNNLAAVYELTGNPTLAIKHFEEALKSPKDAIDRATMRHGLSHALLAAGRLAEGWKSQQSRLDPDNIQATLFAMNCPRWESLDPADIVGKKVVIVGEQGLGDEVLFLNSAHELQSQIGASGELRIACEQRLVPLIQRSFPLARVDNHLSTVLEGRNVRTAGGLDRGADFWTPMGDQLGAFRPSVESFPDTPAFLTPDLQRADAFRQELAALGPGLKVGVLWKSLKMTGSRARFFSPLDAWKPVLQTPGVTFINMQYGETADDIQRARDEFGVTLYTPETLDLKNDLDGVAAMGQALDLMIGPMTASINLAAACGGDVWVFLPHRRHWITFSSDRLPWYPSARLFFGDGFGDWTGIMAQLAAALRERVAQS